MGLGVAGYKEARLGVGKARRLGVVVVGVAYKKGGVEG